MNRALLFTVTVLLTCTGLGQDFIWTETAAPATQWQFVSSSSDGTKLMAAVYGVTNEIYTSTDSGSNWIRSDAPTVVQWSCGASSADGSCLVAAVGDGVFGGIYVSTNSGLSWMPTAAPNKNWWSVAASADGTKLVAASGGSIFGSGIYASTNGGVTWVPVSTPTNGTYCVASSADGVKCFAGDYSGAIYASTNSGLSWFQTSAPSSKQWSSIASSSDGTKLVAVVFGGGIFVSTNSGSTWAPTTAAITNWFRVASSADGALLAALCATGIYTSTNSGLTWIRSAAPNSAAWWSIGSSSNGTHLVAAVSGGGIYRGETGYSGAPPTISTQPQSLSITSGFSASFAISVSGLAPFTYQWRFNNADIGYATDAALILPNVFPKHAGLYSVIVSNIYGYVTSNPALLTVLPFSLTEPCLTAGRGFQFNLDTASNVSYTIQYSSTLNDWTPLAIFRGGGGPMTIIDPAAVGTQRFYRVVLSP
jgi:hypothetical protein